MDSHVDPRGEVVDAHGGIESSEAPARTMGSQPPLASIELPSQLEMGELRPGGGHERASHPEPEDIFAKTMNLMNSKAYQKAAPFTSVGLRKRLEMIKNAGVPPLRVVRLSTLIELGCIPRSTEGYAVDALQEVKRLQVECPSNSSWDPDTHDHLHAPLLVFFSHRWTRPTEGFPDGTDNAKAKALINWGKQELWERRKRAEVLVRHAATCYNRNVEAGESWQEIVIHVSFCIWVAIVLVAWAVGNWWLCLIILPCHLAMEVCRNLGMRSEDCKMAAIKVTGRKAKVVGDEVKTHIAHLPTEVLFFIDYTCVDQQNPSAEVGALPAYVSACSEILSHYDGMYALRAWCRAEMMLAYAFTGELHRKKFETAARNFESVERLLDIRASRDRTSFWEVCTCACACVCACVCVCVCVCVCKYVYTHVIRLLYV